MQSFLWHFQTLIKLFSTWNIDENIFEIDYRRTFYASDYLLIVLNILHQNMKSSKIENCRQLDTENVFKHWPKMAALSLEHQNTLF